MIKHFELNTVYPLWWTLFCVIGGIFYAAFLYLYKNDEWKGINNFYVYSLAFLRFAVASVLLFLLLEPFFKNTYYQTIRANVAILQDNSHSIILNKDSIFYKKKYPQLLSQLKNKLNETEHIKAEVFYFNESIKANDSLSFSGKATNISKALQKVEDFYTGQNLKAIILATDGIFNSGKNPLYWQAKNNQVVYTIALGDTAIPTDALIKNAWANEVVLLKDDFEVKFEIQFKQLKGKSAKISITHNNKETVFNKTYFIKKSTDLISESVILSAKQSGWQQYTISVSEFDNEISYKNNQKTFFVKVIDNRSKILLLAHAPHPDVSAIKRALENNKNFELDILYEYDLKTLPVLKPYSLIIAHQIPSNTTKNSVIGQLKSANKPLLFIVGTQTNRLKFNNFNIKPLPQNNRFNDVSGYVSSTFDLMEISEATTNLLKQVAPLKSPFGKIVKTPEETIMLYQQIGNVTTDYPLFSFIEKNQTKYALLLGEGIWRWRMTAYQLNNDFTAFDDWLNTVIQYMSVIEDKSLLQITVASEYNENDNIIFKGKLYNPAFESITTSDITLIVNDNDNHSYTYKMLKRKNDYVLSIGTLPTGIYEYTAVSEVNNKKVTASGKFIVKEMQLEALNTVAQHQLLQQIAIRNNGKMVIPKQLNELIDEIKTNNQITAEIEEQKDYKNLIHYKWLFFMLVILVSLEWLGRKWQGIM